MENDIPIPAICSKEVLIYKSDSSSKPIRLKRGALVIFYKKIGDSIKLHTCDKFGIATKEKYLCSETDKFSKLTRKYWQILIPVDDPGKRYDLSQNEIRLQFLLESKINDYVVYKNQETNMNCKIVEKFTETGLYFKLETLDTNLTFNSTADLIFEPPKTVEHVGDGVHVNFSNQKDTTSPQYRERWNAAQQHDDNTFNNNSCDLENEGESQLTMAKSNNVSSGFVKRGSKSTSESYNKDRTTSKKEIYHVVEKTDENPEVHIVEHSVPLSQDLSNILFSGNASWPKHVNILGEVDVSNRQNHSIKSTSNSSNSSTNSSNSMQYERKQNQHYNTRELGSSPASNTYENSTLRKEGSDSIFKAGEDAEYLKDFTFEKGSVVKIKDGIFGIIQQFGKVDNSHVALVEVLTESCEILQQKDINDAFIFLKPKDGHVYVDINQCSRFNEEITTNPLYDERSISNMECKPIKGEARHPQKICSQDQLQQIVGNNKGIQGHHNSCYLDATLFSMFAFTDIFDFLLNRKANTHDPILYNNVQKVLCEEIVNPLRKNYFVSANHVMNLRKLLNDLHNVSGYTTEEKDPEEFLNILFVHIFNAEPLLKLNSGQDTFYYQLFVEKDERLEYPTVQQLLHQSFSASDLKLKELPSCLIIQMPRFGKKYKMYPRVLPSQVLDVTDIIDDSPRQCFCCGNLATIECIDCFNEKPEVSLEVATYCYIDFIRLHQNRKPHKNTRDLRCGEFKGMDCIIPRLYLELFAVICIETSHYVAFVKTGPGDESPWCFHDSMADRIGEENGYNIPELISVPDIAQLLKEDKPVNMEQPTKHAKRLLSDAYMCLYRSQNASMYK